MKHLTTILCILLFSFKLFAQPEAPSPIIFIYDASGSMWGKMQSSTKMDIASSVLSTSVKNLPDNQKIGLVAYGHRKKGDCQDVETLVSMDNTSKSKIASTVKSIKPLGMTPLAYSATTVIDQLRKSKVKATIILVTDGIESCDGNICEVVKAAKKEGIDFKLHIVGFGLKTGESAQLECAAQAGDGNYYDAADASGLGKALGELVVQTIDKKKGNHGVFAMKNSKAIDALVTAYKSGTKEKMGGTRTYKDTSYFYLPPGKYDIEVSPLEGSDVKPITVTDIQTFEKKKTKQVVNFDGAKFLVTITNNGKGWDSTVKAKTKEGKPASSARTYGGTKEMEVNPGVYDIDVLAIDMYGFETSYLFKDMEIKAGEEKVIIHDFKTGIAKIGVQENGTLVDVVVGIFDADKTKSVAGGRSYTSTNSNPRAYVLNPGTYSVKLRGNKNGKDQIIWHEITVKEGETFTKMYEW